MRRKEFVGVLKQEYESGRLMVEYCRSAKQMRIVIILSQSH